MLISRGKISKFDVNAICVDVGVSCGEAAQVLGCLILVLPGDNSDEEQKRTREEEKKRRREEEKKSFWVSEVTFLNFY